MNVASQGQGRGGFGNFRRDAFSPGIIVLVAGLLAIVVPSVLTLAKWSWSSGAGAHGPIVLATGLWLLWHERHLATGAKPAPLFPTILLILAAVPFYYIGRVVSVLMIEGLACFAICIAVAALYFGWRTVAKFWFPILYLMFIITPPENWIFVGTRPLKLWLSNTAVELMSAFGANIAGSANMILIDGYQLQVASACSGVNSLIGIVAIGSFYIYLRHGSQLRYAALMMVLLIPVAIVTNFIRIVALILVTQASGEGVAFDVAHELGGIVIFMFALFLLVAMDEALFPLCRRWRFVR